MYLASDLFGCCATLALILWPRFRAPQVRDMDEIQAASIDVGGKTRCSSSRDKKQPPADGLPRAYASGAPIDIPPGVFLQSSAYGG